MSHFKIVSAEVVTAQHLINSGFVWRSYDGAGTNIYCPHYGMKASVLLRKSPVSYVHSSITGVSERGNSNPSPRLISNEICQGSLYGGSPESSLGLTDLTWIWGQFVDHELDTTHPQVDGETLNISTDDGGENEEYPGRTIPFNRSTYVIKDGVREHVNDLPAFMDASNVYGSDLERIYELRLLDGSGKMKMGFADNGETLMPYNTKNLANASSTGSNFFLAGDIRANENVALLSMHTLFVREHNRLCDDIVRREPEIVGQDELIYQRARTIIAGIMQKITYKEFLPHLMGGQFNPPPTQTTDVNACIATEFSSAGFRLGHTMISENIQIGTNPSNVLSLVTAFFNPSYVQENGINNILIGASRKKMQEIDNVIVEAIRSFLFGAPAPAPGLMHDLACLNIQRGRDHGLPGYNAVRQAYGLSTFSTFASLPMKETVISRLESIYDSVDDIDPWIGIICELHEPGYAIGPLATAIFTDQFTRIKNGDRFWYETDRTIKPGDLEIIQNTKLSSVLIRNLNYSFPSDVFHVS